MKKVAFVILGLLMGLIVNAQEKATLFNSNPSLENLGFSVSALSQFTQVNNQTGIMGGFKAGLIINDRFSIGGYYLANLNEINASQNFPDTYLDLKMGGGYLEYSLWSNKLVHLTFPLFIGGGELSLDNKGEDFIFPDGGEDPFGDDYFFVVEPGVQAEVNVHKNVRFHLGAGYRIVNGVDYLNFDNAAVSGLSFTAGLEIGLFTLKP
jgi:hypothetical protein